MEESMFSIYDS